jgi:hypothetical protein
MWRGEGQWDQKSPAPCVFSISSLSLNWISYILWFEILFKKLQTIE